MNQPRVCPNCGLVFIPSHWRQKFCSKKCMWTYHNNNRNLTANVTITCCVCGKVVKKYIEPSKQALTPMIYCSRKCKGAGMSGKNHPNWTGGKRINDQGYVLIYMPGHHEADYKGHVREHRIVMEKHLGRRLTKEEVVHHINGDPADNRIENLQLFPSQAAHKQFHYEQREIDAEGRFLRKDNRDNG